MRQALADFGGDPEGWRDVDRRGKGVAAYVESHIEQGPVLLNEGFPVGVVTAIAGCTRMQVRVTGLAGHAGTVPMGSRHDALAAAAEMLLFVERHCEDRPGLVGTVGKIAAAPGAINVIAQEVEFTIDVRSGEDAPRRDAVAAFVAGFDAIARRRRVRVIATPFYTLDAAHCDARLQQYFAEAIAAHGIAVRHLPSGAGHDAMVFAAVAPMAMLFVRCGNNGISHHPDETITAEDAEIGTSVLLRFFEQFDPAAFAHGR
jgi:hydantoinase/carbamoylase family amidase